MLKTLASHQLVKTTLSTPFVPRIVLSGITTTTFRAFNTTASSTNNKVIHTSHDNVDYAIPKDVYRELLESRPIPMREEFIEGQSLTTQQLESIDFGPNKHYKPTTFGDKAALYTVKFLRTLPDTYFQGNHYMRAVMLETIAAVPGMVGAMLRHMKSLRNMSEDHGWISHLLHEAENERMHLMTFMKCMKPSIWNRLLVLGAQGVFFNAYFMLYLFNPKVAHRMCGYLEEEAVVSYTHFLNDLDAGKLENTAAPQVAIDYYNLTPNATIRDVVLAIRADEAVHRDANHFFSDRIAQKKEDILEEVLAQHHRQSVKFSSKEKLNNSNGYSHNETTTKPTL